MQKNILAMLVCFSFLMNGCSEVLFPMTRGSVTAAGYEKPPQRRFLFSKKAKKLRNPANSLYVDFDFVKSIQEYREKYFVMPSDITFWRNNSLAAISGFNAMKDHNYYNMYISYTSADTLKVHFNHSNIVKEELKRIDWSEQEKEIFERNIYDFSTKGTFIFWLTKDSLIDYFIKKD